MRVPICELYFVNMNAFYAMELTVLRRIKSEEVCKAVLVAEICTNAGMCARRFGMLFRDAIRRHSAETCSCTLPRAQSSSFSKCISKTML